MLQECLWAKSSRAQYGIWALKVIAALGQGEEIEGQAAQTVSNLWRLRSVQTLLPFPTSLLHICVHEKYHDCTNFQATTQAGGALLWVFKNT